MIKDNTIRRCQYCHKSLEGTHWKRQSCNNTCKTYALEVRKGKREPVPFPEDQLAKDIKDAEYQNTELQILEKEYHQIQVTLKKLQVDSLKIKKELYEPYQEKYGRLRFAKSELREAERVGIDERIEDWELEVDLAEDELELLKPNYEKAKIKLQAITSQAKALSLKAFRCFTKISDIRIDTFNARTKGVASASELREFEKYKAAYPFDNALISDENIFALGKQPRPFTCMIYGNSESGKTLLALNICLRLIENFESEILYIADRQQINKGIDEMIRKTTQSDLLYLCQADIRKDIYDALERKEFEFLVIDSCNYFKLDFGVIRSIMNKYPKLSIFCICNGIISSLRDNVRTVFEIRSGWARLVKGQANDRYGMLAWDDAQQWSNDNEPMIMETEMEENPKVLPKENTNQFDMKGMLELSSWYSSFMEGMIKK